MQQKDFEGIYEAMEGRPVTIRFLDPPLHEFLPTNEKDIETLAKDTGKSVADIKAIIERLHEFNPMMGHRGVRLGITYPGITEMQVRALFEATAELMKDGKSPKPEIMVPVTIGGRELKITKISVDKIHEDRRRNR